MKKSNYTKRILASLFLVMLGYSASFALSGTYTVGAGGNYATLTAAVSDLNTYGVTGPVIFNILNGTYSGEQVIINNVSGASAVNRVTFQSASGNRADVEVNYGGSSSSDNYVFQLNGASFITIKNITINNTGSTYGTDILLAGTSSEDSIVNCLITGNTSNSTSTNKSRIYSNPLSGSHLVVTGCQIERGSYGIYIRGNSTSTTSDDHVFNDNTFLNNYYGYIYGYYLGNTEVKNNTCTATSVSTHYGIYFNYQQKGMDVEDNTVTTTGSGTCYGVSNYYFGNYYNGSSSTPLRVKNNNISIVSSGSTYGVYMYYYCYYLDIDHNTIFSRSTSYGSTYGIYAYYYPLNCKVTDNSITTQGNSGTGYPFYVYYTNNSSSHFLCTGNVVNASNTTGTLYAWYSYYHQNAYYANNQISATTTSGTIYGYGPMYYNFNSRATNNTITYTKTSYGSIYNYGNNYYGTADTFDHNTITINAANSTVYNYLAYFGTGKVLQNTYNVNTSSGSLYNYMYYANGALIDSNIINATTYTGTNYGIYSYYGSSPSVFSRNKCNFSSTYGTVYGIYAYFSQGHTFLNNVVTTQTAGTNYTMQSYYSSPKMYNNNFHSNSSGSNNYAAYIYNTSSSYTPVLRNNIFSRSGSNGYLFYTYRSDYLNSDYNLFYTPGSNYFQCVSPSVNATTLTAWKAATSKDKNSLVYNPGYMDASANDLRPDPTSPSSWAIQGRGVHITGDSVDINGNARARVPAAGVPDLGAYEFTPTSTPPNADATPAMPVANSIQTFTFGEDTVGTIQWGSAVPATLSLRQYTGVQAGPMPAGVGRMFFYTDIQAPSYAFLSTPVIRYKDPWIGDVSSETNSRLAKSTNMGTWAGYNYTRGITDTVANTLSTSFDLDSIGSYTGVENARIGIRCVVAPEGFAHSNITANAADETWDPIFNPIGYQYVVDNSPATPSSSAVLQFSASNSVSLTGLNEDTKYFVHVRSICGPKDTSGWNVDSFVTLITCHAPTLKVTSLDYKQAVISWDTVKTAVKYEYEISQSSTPPTVGTPTTNNSILATYLKSGTQYYAHVRSFCNSIYDQSPWSTVAFHTTFSTGIEDLGSAGLLVYPNPASDKLNIELSTTPSKDAAIAILDVTGKLVQQIPVQKQLTTINIASLERGIYILKYTDASGSNIMKFTKQ